LRREQDVGGARSGDHLDIATRPVAPWEPRAQRSDAQKVEQEPADLLAHIGRQPHRAEAGREGRERLRRLGSFSVHVHLAYSLVMRVLTGKLAQADRKSTRLNSSHSQI